MKILFFISLENKTNESTEIHLVVRESDDCVTGEYHLNETAYHLSDLEKGKVLYEYYKIYVDDINRIYKFDLDNSEEYFDEWYEFFCNSSIGGVLMASEKEPEKNYCAISITMVRVSVYLIVIETTVKTESISYAIKDTLSKEYARKDSDSKQYIKSLFYDEYEKYAKKFKKHTGIKLPLPIMEYNNLW